MKTVITLALASTLSVVALPCASATEDVGKVPDAVTDSLSIGGEAFNAAAELNQLPTGEYGRAMTAHDVAQTTYGPPLRYEYLALSASSAPTLSADDFYDRGETSYIAVEYLHDVPTSTIEVGADGSFGALGGWLDEEVIAISELASDQILLTDGQFGEAYALTPDLSTVTALNESTREFLGGKTASVSTLRQLKAAQKKAFDAAQPDDIPADSVGSSGIAELIAPQVSHIGSFALIGGGVIAIATATFLLGQRARTDKMPK